MELSWFSCLLYGLLGGFSQFLPVSEDASSMLFAQLNGAGDVGPAVKLAVHLGALAAVCLQYWPQLTRLNRERRIAAIPPRRRKRQPDANSLMDLSLLKTAAIPLILLSLGRFFLKQYFAKLWILALAVLVNGIIIFVVEHRPQSTKDARSLSRVDGILLGISGAAAFVPGISAVASMLCTSHNRGIQRQYGLQTVMLLCIPLLLLLMMFDIVGIIAAGMAWLSLVSALCLLGTVLLSALSAYFGIMLMRFLAVKVGYTAFAFYSWGMALFTFILFLMI